ncbi:MAG TPA: hypothetical protein VFD70_10840 [Anaerolineae bacterium]|nr:hypothetical protein [Anaerolineae bacterium]
MKNNLNPRKVEELWEVGILRAAQDQRRMLEPEIQRMNEAAGLHLKSRIQAGNNSWTVNCIPATAFCTADC